MLAAHTKDKWMDCEQYILRILNVGTNITHRFIEIPVYSLWYWYGITKAFVYLLQEYFIVDADNDRVMVCVNHAVKSSHLYVSDTTGIKYTLSLPNIVYVSPQAVSGTRLPGV